MSLNFNDFLKLDIKFDVEKLKWFNHKYLQLERNEKIADHLICSYQELKTMKKESIISAVELTKERANTLNELWSLCSYLFSAPVNYNEKTLKKVSKDGAIETLSELSKKLDLINIFKEDEISKFIKTWITESGKGFGNVMQPARLALVGELKGIDLYVIFEFLGKEESLSRLSALSKKIKTSLQ